MLKIYAIILTVIALSAPVATYFFVSNSAEGELSLKQEEISQIKSDLNSKELEINNIKNEQTKNAEILEKKNKELKALEEDFKKLFAAQNKGIIKNESGALAGDSNCSAKTEEKECPACPVCEEKKAESISCSALPAKESAEYDALTYVFGKGIGSVNYPYIKGSDIPDLYTLYTTTQNKEIKKMIAYACPKPYYTESTGNREHIITAILKGYCNNKLSKCSEEVKSKIDSIKNNISPLASVGIQLITKYKKDPANYSERVLVYYDENGNRICAWKGTKVGKYETLMRLR